MKSWTFLKEVKQIQLSQHSVKKSQVERLMISKYECKDENIYLFQELTV